MNDGTRMPPSHRVDLPPLNEQATCQAKSGHCATFRPALRLFRASFATCVDKYLRILKITKSLIAMYKTFRKIFNLFSFLKKKNPSAFFLRISIELSCNIVSTLCT